MGSRYELTLHPLRGAGRGLQFPAANGWTARGAPAGLSSCLPTSRCVVRQPLFPIACEGAARALQGMLGREVFRVGERGGGEKHLEFFVLRRGASVLPGDWPVFWRSLSLQSMGGPIGVSPVFIG